MSNTARFASKIIDGKNHRIEELETQLKDKSKESDHFRLLCETWRHKAEELEKENAETDKLLLRTYIKSEIFMDEAEDYFEKKYGGIPNFVSLKEQEK